VAAEDDDGEDNYGDRLAAEDDDGEDNDGEATTPRRTTESVRLPTETDRGVFGLAIYLLAEGRETCLHAETYLKVIAAIGSGLKE
jgi:hypothetical protein